MISAQTFVSHSCTLSVFSATAPSVDCFNARHPSDLQCQPVVQDESCLTTVQRAFLEQLTCNHGPLQRVAGPGFSGCCRLFSSSKNLCLQWLRCWVWRKESKLIVQGNGIFSLVRMERIRCGSYANFASSSTTNCGMMCGTSMKTFEGQE